MESPTITKQSDLILRSHDDYEVVFEHIAAHLQAEGGTIKVADRAKGILEASWKYGINPFGLRVTVNFSSPEEGIVEISLTGSFADAIDTFGTAKKKAKTIAEVITSPINRTIWPLHEEKTTDHVPMPIEIPINTQQINITEPTDHNNVSVAQLKSLSNAKFLKWFLLLNGGLVIGLVWTGPGALAIPFLGFAGALLSLMFCKWLAKRAHGVKVIDHRYPASNEEKHLYEMVAELATRAGLDCVPEVGVYDSPDINAFATGSSPSNALVAFSSSLLNKMDREQIQAVAAHEIAHIANRDMLGTVLLQGVINSIVLIATLPLNLLRVLNIFGDSFSWVVEL